MRKLFALAVVASLALASPAAAQVTLDFNTGGNTCSSYTFGGFNFSGPFCVGSWSNNPVSSNGTAGLIYGYGSMTMTQSLGNPFKLNSLDAGISWYSGQTSAQINYTLDLFGGGQATGSFTIGQGLSTYNFGQTITQATFTGLTDGYVAMDDVVVDSNVVPEPSSFILVAAGLAAFGAMSRRGRNRA